MQQQNIFGDRNYKQKLANFSIDNISDLEDKKKIIEGYIKALESGKIENTKEEAIQADFLNKFFGDILGYDYNDPNLWNLEKESKSVTDGTKADGALGFFSIEGKTKHADVRAIVELKDVFTDLDKSQNRPGDKRTPVEQAFSYASKAGGRCNWVIVSNFKEIRLYRATDQSRYESFMAVDLLNPDHLKRFFFLLQKERLISQKGDSPLDVLYRERLEFEQTISKQFYHRYKTMRIELFEHLKEENPGQDPLLLISKTQKLLDRFIFVCFCEDANLLPSYTLKKTKDILTNAFDFEPNKLWRQLKGLFHSIDSGNPPLDISKFDGGLFAKDDELDSLTIKDSLLLKMIDFSDFDFASDLNVNILGHIFEQSLSDIEEIKAQIGNGRQLYDDEKAEIRKNGKRKKEGIFYTPEYVTRYIVKEAIGGWLDDRKRELGFYNLPELTPGDFNSIKRVRRKNKKDGKMYEILQYNQAIKHHMAFWEAYEEQLLNIKVLDPACGSGAFLNQAFDYLYAEGQKVNAEISRLHLGQRKIFEPDRHILTNNIFGVDLNTESVEITKLSLWLKTARKDKELTALDGNIKCGNSLIDDTAVAGERAFDWEKEFVAIMGEGDFDVIIGNPPYVTLSLGKKQEKANEKEWDFYQKKYTNSLEYKGNTFALFIEKAIRLVKNSGCIGFIVPDTLLLSTTFEKVRGFILKNAKIEYLVGINYKVFNDAEIGSALIFILKKQTQKENNLVNVAEINEEKDFFAVLNYKQIWQNRFLENQSYKFYTDIEGMNLINNISVKSIPLGELVIFYQGIITGDNDKFLANKRQTEKHEKILRGRDIDRYSLKFGGTYVLFDPGKLWSNTDERFFKADEKIINRQTGDRLIAAYDNEQYFCLDSTHIQILKDKNFSLKYILALFNSKLLNFVYRKLTKEVGRTFAQVKTVVLKQLPIVPAAQEQQQAFAFKVEQMTNFNKEFNEYNSTFIRLLQSKWSNLNITGKISEWYRLSFEDFSKELEKQKIKLSLPEQVEWLEYFNQQKQKVVTIMALIEKTDNEIDKMVYELYELTDEEIKILDPMGWNS